MLKDKIRQERLSHHFSLYELSKQSGHSASTLHGIENGRNSNPSFKTICDLARVLNIPLNELAKEVSGN